MARTTVTAFEGTGIRARRALVAAVLLALTGSMVTALAMAGAAPAAAEPTSSGQSVSADATPTVRDATSETTGPDVLSPNDLLVTEVNYDNVSTDFYEYIEVTNTTSHPIDFAADGISLRYGTSTPSTKSFTFHTDGDTVDGSPLTDPVIPARGTQLFWSVNTAAGNDAYWQKTDTDFRSFYGLAASTPIVQVFGQNGLANGGERYYEVFQNSTELSSAYVPATTNSYSGNYAAHFELPTDRSDPTAAVFYNANAHGKQYVTPGTVDVAQVGYDRTVTISDVQVAEDSVKLTNTSSGAVDLSGFVLQSKAGKTYPLPAGTTIEGNDELTVTASGSGFTLQAGDWVALLAPPGYAYSDGSGVIDTTGPFLHPLPYDANSGAAPVTDPTTGLPLPPAGGLYRPAGLSALNGTVYASNTGDNVLAAVANGSNTVLAGALTRYGFDPATQDGGAAADAGLYQPGGSAVDGNGNIYVADSGDNMVLEITKADGKIHLVAGTGNSGGSRAVITGASKGTTVNLYRPQSVAVAANGDLYIADTYDNRVIKVRPGGAATLVAGTGKGGYTGDGGAATSARLAQPGGVALDSAGDVYIADSSNNVIRRVDGHTGVITTVAGDYAADQADNSCLGAYGGDGGPATSAALNDPQGIALDSAGDLFIADTFNNAVREVTPDGTISTTVNVGAAAAPEGISPVSSGSIPGSTHLNTPFAVTVDPVTDALYVADTRNNSIAQVLHVARAGDSPGPVEPAKQISVTGSGKAFAACDALSNPPVVTAISPATGLITGGATVTVTGTHFTGTTGVTFGTLAGTDVVVTDDTHLTVTSPAHAAGPVEVTVSNSAGASTSAPADRFSYRPPAPVITAISPTSGHSSGGTTVTVTGKRLTGATGVRFGTVAGTKVVIVDDTHVRVTSPAHASGRVDVTVTDAAGRSAAVAADRFTFTKSSAPRCSYIADYARSTRAAAKLAKDRRTLASDKAGLSTARTARSKAALRKKIAALDRTITGDRKAVTAAQKVVEVDSGHRGCATQVAAQARLTRAQAKLAKDRKARARVEADLNNARTAKSEAALRKKIAALDKTVAADEKSVTAARKALERSH